MADEQEPGGLAMLGYVAGVAKVGSGCVLEMRELDEEGSSYEAQEAGAR